MFAFRFRLFALGVLSGLFDPERFGQLLTEASRGGYQLMKHEFSIEPSRFMFFLKRLTFGLVFRKDNQKPDADFEYRVVIYKTRLMTRTVDTRKLQQTLNDAAQGGYELYLGIKYPTRLLFFFPRESYTFIFRRPAGQATGSFSYEVFQTPYRFFSRTIDAEQYEQDLNAFGQSGDLKVTFRDERRVLGAFAQPTVVGVIEQRKTAAVRTAIAA